jgi:hypothetical protein
VIQTAGRVAGATTEVAWADDAFVRAQGLVATEQDDPFPMITPDEPTSHLFSNARAASASLRIRSLEETVRDTLAWDDERGAPWPLQAGLSSEREAELLAALEAAS